MIPEYSVRPAVESDIHAIAPYMSRADRDEVWASSKATPEEALYRGFSSPHGWTKTGLHRGVPILMFGVSAGSYLSFEGCPWMLGVARDRATGLALARRTWHHVRKMQRDYPVLVNWTDARHTESHSWLRWAGFTLEPAVPYGPFGLPFHRFWRRSHV